MPSTGNFIFPNDLPSGNDGGLYANVLHMRLGERVTITWNTTLDSYPVALYHQVLDTPEGSGVEANGLVTCVISYDWTVATYDTDITSSPVFYFWVNPGPNGIPSAYFNITTADAGALTTSTSSSTTSSTASSSSTQTPSPSTTPFNNSTIPTSSPSSSHTLAIGIGAGLGIGIPLILLISVFIGLYVMKQRRRRRGPGAAVEMESSQSAYRNDVKAPGSQRDFDSEPHLRPGIDPGPHEVAGSEVDKPVAFRAL